MPSVTELQYEDRSSCQARHSFRAHGSMRCGTRSPGGLDRFFTRSIHCVGSPGNRRQSGHSQSLLVQLLQARNVSRLEVLKAYAMGSQTRDARCNKRSAPVKRIRAHFQFLASRYGFGYADGCLNRQHPAAETDRTNADRPRSAGAHWLGNWTWVGACRPSRRPAMAVVEGHPECRRSRALPDQQLGRARSSG